MLLPVPPPFRRRRGQIKRQLPSAGPPAAVSVVSVTRIDDNIASWLFTSAVAFVGDASGLVLGDQVPDSVEGITPAGALLLFYGSVATEDPWVAGPSGVTLAFANGGTLVLPEAGVVI